MAVHPNDALIGRGAPRRLLGLSSVKIREACSS
jgi:hypothetical protein